MTTESAQANAHVLADVIIDQPSISNLLIELGFDLSDELAPAFILGATDILVAVELAQTLPSSVSFERAVDCCQTLVGEQPDMVRDAQKAVLFALMSTTELPPLAATRAALLSTRLN